MTRLLPVLLILLVVLSACSTPQTQATPTDLLITYEWNAGPLPPPYHYSYSIRIPANGQAEVTMIPGYSGDEVPTWTEAYPLTPAELDALYVTLLEQDLRRETWQSEAMPPVGGSVEALTVVAEGTVTAIPAFPVASQRARAEAMIEAVRATVPAAIFADLETRRETFMNSQPTN